MTTESPQRHVKVLELTNESTNPLRWLDFLDDKDSDIEVPIPITHPAYTDDMEYELERLEPGDEVRMRFTSVNEQNTAWLCSEIASIDGDIRTSQSITNTDF